jgi:hypothetical protein
MGGMYLSIPAHDVRSISLLINTRQATPNMVRFRIHIGVDAMTEEQHEQLGRQLNALTSVLTKELRGIAGMEAVAEEFEGGFIMGNDAYYYIASVGSLMSAYIVTNNPRWVVASLGVVNSIVKSSGLPLGIKVRFEDVRNAVDIEVLLTPGG